MSDHLVEVIYIHPLKWTTCEANNRDGLPTRNIVNYESTGETSEKEIMDKTDCWLVVSSTCGSFILTVSDVASNIFLNEPTESLWNNLQTKIDLDHHRCRSVDTDAQRKQAIRLRAAGCSRFGLQHGLVPFVVSQCHWLHRWFVSFLTQTPSVGPLMSRFCTLGGVFLVLRPSGLLLTSLILQKPIYYFSKGEKALRKVVLDSHISLVLLTVGCYPPSQLFPYVSYTLNIGLSVLCHNFIFLSIRWRSWKMSTQYICWSHCFLHFFPSYVKR